MQFEIDHLTRYRYSVPVSLGEHLLRLMPAPRANQRPGFCEIRISPSPVGVGDTLDDWGNSVRRVSFSGSCTLFEIVAHLEVETDDSAPVCAAGALALPVIYGIQPFDVAPYLAALDDAGALCGFVDPIREQADGDVAGFLSGLNQAINGFYHHGVRLDGEPRRPSETLARREGVCRDLTLLFMAACRQVGLAARFVSGYQQGDGTRERRYLHAWAEVYLPGYGWLGYDPTHGATVGGDHLAVAAAAMPSAVTPVEGGFCFEGSEVNSTLETEILITTR